MAKTAPRPDHQRIAELERELGIGNHEPERGIRADSAVCLNKNCHGETTELRTWSGLLLRRQHQH